jgi:hypothetical protein
MPSFDPNFTSKRFVRPSCRSPGNEKPIQPLIPIARRQIVTGKPYANKV